MQSYIQQLYQNNIILLQNVLVCFALKGAISHRDIEMNWLPQAKEIKFADSLHSSEFGNKFISDCAVCCFNIDSIHLTSTQWAGSFPGTFVLPEGRTPNTSLPRRSSVFCKLKCATGSGSHQCRYVHTVIGGVLIVTKPFTAKVSRF